MSESPVDHPRFAALCADLERLSGQLESSGEWPAAQFDLLAEAGVLGWVIARQYGGGELSDLDLLRGYERLAAACLTTTFILTQRNGACQRIALSKHDAVREELLVPLCGNGVFATVGISHLTTSRQHLAQPAVRAEHKGDRWLLHGFVPWVTGGRQADWIVTGGTCGDGRQILAAVPTALRGVTVQTPPRLMALNASWTGPVELDQVELPERYVIAGPVSQVMKQGTGGGTGSLTTSALALGAARGVLDKLHHEAEQRADLVEIHRSLARERDAVAADMVRAAEAAGNGRSAGDATPSAEGIRQRANSLVLRTAQAYLAASKGAGFVQGHPAERAVREAMFFLVWSCPQPVLAANLREFACVLSDE